MHTYDAFARFYDADLGTFEDDVPFYRELARRVDQPVLELMCGSGRLLQPLAQAGHRVTGVDISTAMLDRARARLRAAKLHRRTTLVAADVVHAIPRGPFGLAIIGLNSFMHLLSTDDQLAVLHRTAESLTPDGLIAIDLFNPDPRQLAAANGELVFEKRFLLENGHAVQKFVVQQAEISDQRIHTQFIYDELDADAILRRTILPFTMRWCYRFELEHLLCRAGFSLEAVYGSYDLESYQTTSEQLLVVARKH